MSNKKEFEKKYNKHLELMKDSYMSYFYKEFEKVSWIYHYGIGLYNTRNSSHTQAFYSFKDNSEAENFLVNVSLDKKLKFPYVILIEEDKRFELTKLEGGFFDEEKKINLPKTNSSYNALLGFLPTNSNSLKLSVLKDLIDKKYQSKNFLQYLSVNFTNSFQLKQQDNKNYNKLRRSNILEYDKSNFLLLTLPIQSKNSPLHNYEKYDLIDEKAKFLEANKGNVTNFISIIRDYIEIINNKEFKHQEHIFHTIPKAIATMFVNASGDINRRGELLSSLRNGYNLDLIEDIIKELSKQFN